MPTSSADFEEDAGSGGQFSLLRTDKPGVCQDINIRALERSFIGALLDRFDDRFAVDNNQPGPELFGSLCRLTDGTEREMGKLNTGDRQNWPMRSCQGTIRSGFFDYPLKVSNPCMIGKGDSTIILFQGSAD